MELLVVIEGLKRAYSLCGSIIKVERKMNDVSGDAFMVLIHILAVLDNSYMALIQLDVRFFRGLGAHDCCCFSPRAFFYWRVESSFLLKLRVFHMDKQQVQNGLH